MEFCEEMLDINPKGNDYFFCDFFYYLRLLFLI